MLAACERCRRFLRCERLGHARGALGVVVVACGLALLWEVNHRAAEGWADRALLREADVVVADCRPRAAFNDRLISFVGCRVALRPGTPEVHEVLFTELASPAAVAGGGGGGGGVPAAGPRKNSSTAPRAAIWKRRVEEYAYHAAAAAAPNSGTARDPPAPGDVARMWSPVVSPRLPRAAAAACGCDNAPWPAAVAAAGNVELFYEVVIGGTGAPLNAAPASASNPVAWAVRCADYPAGECPLQLATPEQLLDPRGILTATAAGGSPRASFAACSADGSDVSPGCRRVAAGGGSSRYVEVMTSAGTPRFRYHWSYHPVPPRLSGLARQVYVNGTYYLVPWRPPPTADADAVYIFSADAASTSQLFQLLHLPGVASAIYVECITGWLLAWLGAHLFLCYVAHLSDTGALPPRLARLRSAHTGTLSVYSFALGLFLALLTTALPWVGVMASLGVPLALIVVAFAAAVVSMMRRGRVGVAYARVGDGGGGGGALVVVHGDTDDDTASVASSAGEFDARGGVAPRPPSPPLKRAEVESPYFQPAVASGQSGSTSSCSLP